MAVLDAPFRSLAKTLASTFGTEATITYTSAGAFDPATQSLSQTTSTATVSVVIDSYEISERGEFVKQGDLMVLVPALGVTEPTVKDRITFDGSAYQIVSTSATYSGDNVATWTLQVRR